MNFFKAIQIKTIMTQLETGYNIDELCARKNTKYWLLKAKEKLMPDYYRKFNRDVEIMRVHKKGLVLEKLGEIHNRLKVVHSILGNDSSNNETSRLLAKNKKKKEKEQ